MRTGPRSRPGLVQLALTLIWALAILGCNTLPTALQPNQVQIVVVDPGSIKCTSSGTPPVVKRSYTPPTLSVVNNGAGITLRDLAVSPITSNWTASSSQDVVLYPGYAQPVSASGSVNVVFYDLVTDYNLMGSNKPPIPSSGVQTFLVTADWTGPWGEKVNNKPATGFALKIDCSGS